MFFITFVGGFVSPVVETRLKHNDKNVKLKTMNSVKPKHLYFVFSVKCNFMCMITQKHNSVTASICTIMFKQWSVIDF